MPEKETENQKFTRVLRELRAIADNPQETGERRRKAQGAIKEMLRGSHISPEVGNVRSEQD
jgi:hypothetical protein